MKVIHIADVHLGCVPDAGKDWSKKRARDIWDSFAEVVALAGQQKADFLFITGDLFHGQPLKRDLREVNELFRKIPDTRVLLLAGNHDYMRPKSYYLSYPWAENVYLFKREELDYYDFPELHTTVYGLSYWHREIAAKLYDEVQPIDKSRTNLLLAHGGDVRHIPFSPEKIINHGFDYLFAGHIHKGGWLIADRALMAGSLEPTDCNDVGPHGYWMGELEKGRCNMHFFPIRKCEYCHEIYEVTPQTTEWEIRNWAGQLLRERPAYQYFRLNIRGRKAPDANYHLEFAETMERIVDVTVQLVTDYDYDRLEREYAGSLLGAYIKTMRGKEGNVVSQKALEYGVQALLGERDM